MNEKEICWNITARCNQACKYCHRFLGIKDLSYNDNLSILNNLISSGINAITWTGGEALMIDGLEKLLKISYEHGIKNKLITNGKLLTNEKLDSIYKYLDSITISIDSVDDNINEFLGRGKNHYFEVKTILDYIKSNEYATKIRINSVICNQNKNSINKLNEFLELYDIYSWRIFKFMPLREKSIKNKNLFSITLKEYMDVINNIKKISKINNIETRIENDMEKKYILILADGSIYITENGIDKKIGNALVDKISNFL